MEIFRSILQAAVGAGASDIHIKVGGPVMFRINRELIPIEAPLPSKEWIFSVLRQLVTEAQWQQLESDRELDLAIDLPDIGRFRTNVYQQRGNYVLAIRLVKGELRDFEQLHLPDTVRKIAESRRGIIIIAGAPGAGKSTTLAAIIHHLNTTVRRHIITLEDPIEYLFRDKLCIIEQREVGLDTGSFTNGLRNVLRQDPDVLVIGEMRDAASVAAAVSAANVGTLVISTLHTGDAARSIQRILEFFPSAEREHARRQIAATLNAVICQKLIRTTPGTIIPAVEILVNSATVRKTLEEDKLEQLSGTIEMGEADGMQTFEQALLRLIAAGTISQAEAYAHAPNPEGLRMKLQGVVLSENRRILRARN